MVIELVALWFISMYSSFEPTLGADAFWHLTQGIAFKLCVAVGNLCCFFQFDDAVKEAERFVLKQADPPFIEEKFISHEIGEFKLQVATIFYRYVCHKEQLIFHSNELLREYSEENLRSTSIFIIWYCAVLASSKTLWWYHHWQTWVLVF